MSRAGLALERVTAVHAAIGITNQSAAFCVDREIIKVEEISAAGAGCSFQANRALLNGVVRRGVYRDPVCATVIGGGDIHVPDILAIKYGPVRIAYAAGDTVAGADERERRAIVIACDDHWKYGVCYSERSAHIGISRPRGTLIARMCDVCVTVAAGPPQINRVGRLAGRFAYVVLPDAD